LDEARFIAIEKVQAVGVVGERFEGDGLTGRLIHTVEFDADTGILALHFEIEGSTFNGPEAALTPLSNDDFFNEIGFDAIARLEAEEIGIESLLEALRGLVGEKNRFGGEPMGLGFG
jgi:hypothetical protein